MISNREKAELAYHTLASFWRTSTSAQVSYECENVGRRPDVFYLVLCVRDFAKKRGKNQGSPRYRFFLRYQIGRYCEMTVLFKRLTVFRFLTVPLFGGTRYRRI